jgi:hypothetical protein
VSRYAVASHPMELTISASDYKPVPDGLTFAELAPPSRGYVCHILTDDVVQQGGVYVSRDDWGCTVPLNAVVTFHRAALGGGGGSNPLRLLLSLALMVALPGLAPFLKLNGLLLGVSSNTIMLGGALIGNALINALVPIGRPNMASGSDASPTYSIGAQGNQARLDSSIPELFGRNVTFPDYAAPPYSLFVDNDQYLHFILVVGRGQYTIRRISNDDTSLLEYNDVQLWRVGPEQASLDGPGTGYDTLADYQAAVPAGIRVLDNVVTAREVGSVELESGRWTAPYSATPPERESVSVGFDFVLPYGLDSGRSISWQIQMRPVDDFDAALGAWSTLATETYNTAKAETIRLSYDYTHAQGRYQFKVQRTDTRSTTNGSRHDITLGAMRATLAEPGIDFDDVTLVIGRVRATAQLSGTLQIKVMSDRMLPVWDGSVWSANEITRNPAWVFAYICKSRGYTDDQIGLSDLLTYSAIWDARQDRFDWAFDTRTTFWEALQQVCQVGRAVPIVRAGTVTLWRDQQETTPVAAFTMRDIRRGSYRLKQTVPMPDPVDALDVEYRDHRRLDWVTVTAQYYDGAFYAWRGAADRIAQGLPVPTGRAKMRMPGVAGENHAKRQALYYLADTILRTRRASISTELTGLLPAYGSLCLLQHDVGDFGQGGDVVDWDDGARVLETTEPLVWEQGARHYVRLVKPAGRLTGAIEVTQVDAYTMTLDATDYAAELADSTHGALEIITDDADRERTRYVFGPASNVGAMCKPRVIQPRSELEIDIELVLEDDGVHTVDEDYLPGADEQDPIGDGGTVPDTGGDYLINLTSREMVDGGYGPFDGAAPGIEFAFLSDGRLRVTRMQDSAVSYIAAEWITPQTVGTPISELYEVYVGAPSISGSPGFPEFFDVLGTYDTWIGLETSPAFSVRIISGGSDIASNAVFPVQIREAASGTVLQTKTFTVTMQTGSGGA